MKEGRNELISISRINKKRKELTKTLNQPEKKFNIGIYNLFKILKKYQQPQQRIETSSINKGILSLNKIITNINQSLTYKRLFLSQQAPSHHSTILDNSKYLIMGNLCQSKAQVQLNEKIENPPVSEVFTAITEKKYQNVMFKLYDGHPLKYKADALINAKENPYQQDSHSLLLNLKKEVIDEIAQKDPLNPGEASYTQSGLHDITYFIHCCLPTWQGGQDGGKNELYYCIQAYYNSFKIADQLNVRSIVFTDQNVSMTQIPKNLSAEAFVKGALKFINENQNSNLQEVIIVNKNKPSNNAMKNQINGQLSVDMNDELKQMIMHKESAFLDNTERSIRQNTLNRTDTLSNYENNQSLVKQNSDKQILSSQEVCQEQNI